MNGVEKYAREAMPIQEEEKSFGETSYKGETNIENRQQQAIPISQRNWIDIELQRFKGPCCFQMSTFFLLNYFDTRNVVEKKMSEFLMIE